MSSGQTGKPDPRVGTDASKEKPHPRAEDRPDHERNDALVDETIDDSFPASDPPSWSSSTGAGAPKKSGEKK
jgi:hypothetical protein